MRHIVAYSGGIASAHVIALVPHIDEVYFNDTRWEHEDLYRFNLDVEKHFGIKLTEDSDGRDPEQVFNDEHCLGSNRIPLCSRILKGERLQKHAKPGDTLYFGIMPDEINRAGRIRAIYNDLGVNTEFPLITANVSKQESFKYWADAGVRKPWLYAQGFEHNNCSGGCVRAGKRSWARLYHTDPVTYQKRSDVEQRFNEKFKCNYSYIRDCTLEEFVLQIKKRRIYQFDDDGWDGECIGLCAWTKSIG